MHHLSTLQLETSRLTLRRFTVADAPAMFANWANDREVTRYLTWEPHGDITVTQKVLADWETTYAQQTHYSWGIEIRESGELIGSIAVVAQNEEAQLMGLGYCIGRAWWRRGYASEALGRVIRFLMEEVGAKRVTASHDARNPNSGKVMQKAGMHCEGTLRRAISSKGEVCDMTFYAILAKDYFSAAES